jgi:hypothetical protein
MGSLWDALQRMTNKRRRPGLWLCRSRLSRFAKAVQCRRSNGRDCLGVPNPLGAWISGSPSKLARGKGTVSYRIPCRAVEGMTRGASGLMPLFMKRRTLKISVDLIPQSPDPGSGTLRSLKKERTSSRARILLLKVRILSMSWEKPRIPL